MKLIGTCQLKLDKIEGLAGIEFDLKEQSIAAYLPLPPKEILHTLTHGREIIDISPILSEICVYSRSAELRCNKIPSCYISSVSGGGLSLDDNGAFDLVNLNNNLHGLLKLNITLKGGRLVFETKPLNPNVHCCHELVLTNQSNQGPTRFSVKLDSRTYTVRFGSALQVIAGRSSEKHREVFRLVSSLISLTRESIIIAQTPGRLMLNYYWSRSKGYGKSPFAKNELPRVYQDLAKLLCEGSEREMRRRRNEIMLLVCGFDQELLLEDRATNLFRALESFDKCKTLSANRIAQQFCIDKGDALFICEVRNKLFHEGMSIKEAARAAHKEITARDKVRLKRFKRLGPARDIPWKVYVTLARFVTSAFLQDVGISTAAAPVFGNMKAY